jgi:2'-5' RNA ligase
MQESPFRAFVAVELPEALSARCGSLIEKLRGEGGKVSWVKSGNLHLTLKFLGNATPSQAERLLESLAHKLAKGAPFDVELRGLGVFPSLRRPRVIWVGVGDGAPALCALAQKVEGAAAKAGFPRESRSFSPHLTLGRVKMRSDAGDRADPGGAPLGRLLAREDPGSLGRFSVPEVVLFKSRLDPGGAIHTPVHRVRLGRPETAPPAPRHDRQKTGRG